jgi:tetraacyldisaccharide 4'-kinase
MPRATARGYERFERYLLRLIQLPGADQGHPWPTRLLLLTLAGASKLFQAVVQGRLFLYDLGILRRYPLGCQVISVGNITVGGTGKTPVVEVFARELQQAGRKVAILSRGYRKKELPWYQRLLREQIAPPRVVSDGRHVLLDSEMGGDEPYMLAVNLPGVVVLVDRNRVKSGRYAVRKFGCDTLVLDDGFQYQKLKHRLELVLVDCTNPFGNGNLLPRGILREPVTNLQRANFIFLTKSDGRTEPLRRRIAELRPGAEIIECRHAPHCLRDAFSAEEKPLAFLQGLPVLALSGIAVPQSFESSLRGMGARILECARFADHHRFVAQEIIDAVNRADEIGAQAVICTEKDAVRLPRLEHPAVPIFYLRVDIEILHGAENFAQAVAHICFRAGTASRVPATATPREAPGPTGTPHPTGIAAG